MEPEDNSTLIALLVQGFYAHHADLRDIPVATVEKLAEEVHTLISDAYDIGFKRGIEEEQRRIVAAVEKRFAALQTEGKLKKND